MKWTFYVYVRKLSNKNTSRLGVSVVNVRRLCSMPLRPYCKPFQAVCELFTFVSCPSGRPLIIFSQNNYIPKPLMYIQGPNSYRQTMLYGPSKILPYFWAAINVYPCLSINLYFQISWANCDCGLIKVILLFLRIQVFIAVAKPNHPLSQTVRFSLLDDGDYNDDNNVRCNYLLHVHVSESIFSTTREPSPKSTLAFKRYSHNWTTIRSCHSENGLTMSSTYPLNYTNWKQIIF